MITITNGLRPRIRKGVATLGGAFASLWWGRAVRLRTDFLRHHNPTAKRETRTLLGFSSLFCTRTATSGVFFLKRERSLRIQDMARATDGGDERLVRLFRRQVTGFPHFCEIKPGR